MKNTASEEERKVLALVPVPGIRRPYVRDWLLMGAQGYQGRNSTRNPKSRVGAIGIMQIMPHRQGY